MPTKIIYETTHFELTCMAGFWCGHDGLASGDSESVIAEQGQLKTEFLQLSDSDAALSADLGRHVQPYYRVGQKRQELVDELSCLHLTPYAPAPENPISVG